MSAAVALASDLKFSPLLKTKRQHFWMSRPIWRQVIHTHIHKHTNTHDLYGSGGKIIFWSHLGEERPEKPQKFQTHFRGRIESIKSAGKRSQKVTLITCPRHFLETLISCLIYMPKNASVGLRVLKCSKIGHARRMGNSICEIALNNEFLRQFLSDCKVLWMTLEQLVETFIKLPIFDTVEQYLYGSGGKINF